MSTVKAQTNSPGRQLLAVLAGLVVAGALLGAVEFLGHKFYPPPPGLDLTDANAMAKYAEAMPVQALMLVLFGWSLGTFAGAWVAARLAARVTLGLLVGGIFLCAAVATMLMIPHPQWMWITAIVVIPASAYLGGHLAVKGRA